VIYREYDPAVLKKLQNVEIEMLKDFVLVCEKYSLNYFAIAGTAIGAIRHKGFIPWDDDLDIGIMREDTDKLIISLNKEFPNKYDFAYPAFIDNFPAFGLHICKKGTIFLEDSYKNIKGYNYGIFLDIYMFDYVYDDEKKMRRQILKAWFWGKLYVLSLVKDPNIYFTGITYNIVWLACKVIHFAIKLFHIKPSFFFNRAFYYTTLCKRKGIIKTETLAYCFSTRPFDNIIKYDDIFPLQKIEFEGIKINLPNKIHEWLERIYGDYMKLPPEDKRHNHPPFLLDFGDE
jgi:lipopolysaccharide cholinephosphotransferase